MSSQRPEDGAAIGDADARASQTPDTQPDPDPPAGSNPPPEPSDAGPKDERSEVARLRDQLLRTAADFDNYRKRTRRELEDATRRGRGNAIKDMLPVFDNLERAAAHAGDAPEAKSLADGLRIVLKQFVDTLDRMGVKRVATVGQPFDPSVHEAIQHMSSDEHPPGVVVAEVQPGYMNGTELLRAAMVVVSKGPEAS